MLTLEGEDVQEIAFDGTTYEATLRVNGDPGSRLNAASVVADLNALARGLDQEAGARAQTAAALEQRRRRICYRVV